MANSAEKQQIWDGVQENCDGWQCVTYGDKYREWARCYNDKIAVTDGLNRLSYADMEKRSLQIAAYFLAKGIRKGNKVILQIPNHLLFLPIFFGLCEIGAIPVMALPAHNIRELKGVSKAAKPYAYIGANDDGDEERRKRIEQFAREQNIGHVIFAHELVEDNIKAFDIHDFDYEKPTYIDIAMLLLSGGTTGIPKLIPRTHGDYIYDNNMLAQRCRLDHKSVFLAVLPAAHNFTLGNPGVLGTLSVGGRVVMCQAASPMDILSLIEEQRVTFSSMVAPLASLCVEYRDLDASADLSSWKFLLIGGSMLARTLAERIEPALGCRLVQIYGTAEGLNCINELDDPLETRLSCQGKPISPYDEMHIVGADGVDVPPGNTGELITRGPYTIKGYYGAQAAANDSFTKDGYYCTGDKACITENGDLQIVGRIREQINRAGEKISPSELEELLGKHEAVQDCMVVGVPDDKAGERICVFLILREGERLSLREAREYLAGCGLASYKLPDQLECIWEWPLTSVGKPDKKRLIAEAGKSGS